ncbi:hypothetical protein AB0G79_27805 [Streptomyces sp. NPDC020807]|uniref:hypothetical protein n=1 Tax=Streptomyces sp. NPDC020807 TaxID=3155119 RepID=UPI0033E55F6A
MSNTRRTHLAQLLAIGRRTAGTAHDPRARLHAAALALAAAAATLLIWGLIANHAVFEARDTRTAGRTPLFTEAGKSSPLRWIQQADQWNQRQFSVIAVDPLVPDAPLPPGLPRWPEPGEAFVSPALLDAMPAAENRYGRLAGTVAPQGLADPGEFFVYRRPAVPVPPDGKGDSTSGVSGFGYPGPLRPDFFASQGTARDETDLHWLFGPLLALPVGALLVIAFRLGARRRDQRLTVLHAMGARRSTRAWISVGEAAGPLGAGTAAAALALTVVSLTGITLPVTGYRIAASDLTPTVPVFLVCAAAGWGVLCTLFALLHLRIRRVQGNRPRPRGAQAPGWPAYAFGGGLVLAFWGATLGSDFGTKIFQLGTVLTLAGFPSLLGRGAALAGAWAGERSKGDAARLIGTRWVSAHPAVIARAGAALVIVLGLMSQAQIFMSALDDESRSATALARSLDGRLADVRSRPLDPASAERFSARLSPKDRIFRVDDLRSTASPGLGGSVVTASCPDLALLGRLSTCPGPTPVPLQTAFVSPTPRTEALRWIGNRDIEVRAGAGTSAPELLRGAAHFAVFVHDGDLDRVKEAAYTTLALPSVDTPGDYQRSGPAAMSRISDWVMLAASTGFALLLLTGAIALLGTFLDRAEELRPLAAFTSGHGFHLRVAWWGVGAPLVLTVVLSTALVAMLALFNLAFIYWGAQRPPFTMLHAGILGALTLCAVGTVAGAQLSSRFTHRWVPRGD